MIDTAIFDVDGTLIDSMPRWRTISVEWLKKKGYESKYDLIEIYDKKGYYECCRLISEEFPFLGSRYDVNKAISLSLFDFYNSEVKETEGARDFLLELKNRGFKLYVFTANFEGVIVPSLKQTGMFDLFDDIIFPTEYGLSKRNPEAFDFLLEKIGAKAEECIFFEDSPPSLRNAKAKGIKTVGVSLHNEEREDIRKIADEVITNYLEIIKRKEL